MHTNHAQSPIGQRPNRPHGAGASLPAPRFGRGGPCLGHLIHPRRNACAFRVRDFEQSTGLFNPALPDRLSPPTRGGSADAEHPRYRQSEGLPSRSRRFASTPRFGRGGSDLDHRIHPMRNACAFRVRPFEQSTGLFNPALPNHASHQRTHATARQYNQK